MTSTAATEVPAAEGWYLSPARPEFDQWWDGSDWAEEFRPTSKEPFRSYAVPLYRIRRHVTGAVLIAAWAFGAIMAMTSLFMLVVFVVLPGGYDFSRGEFITHSLYIGVPLAAALLTIPILIFSHRHMRKMGRTEFPNGRVPMSAELKQQLLTGATFVGYAVLAGALTAPSQPAHTSAPRQGTRRSTPKKVNDSSIFNGKYTWKNLGGGSNW